MFAMNTIHCNKNKVSSQGWPFLSLGSWFIGRTFVGLITVIILFALVSLPGHTAVPVLESFSIYESTGNATSHTVDKPTGTGIDASAVDIVKALPRACGKDGGKIVKS